MTKAATPHAPLQLWGGVECTVNRVGDRYHDQLVLSGHDRPDRASDLDLFAGLGLRAMRYPILWERCAPDGLERADFSWADARLGRLRTLGIEVIAGLMHHGSGPRGTDLLDPGLAGRLAEYAGAVARRYPWVTAWTPVDEPLTTARFSGLYGLWYPHRQDDHAFVCMLLEQVRAVRAAMRAVREVIPGARLVQPEDLGSVHSTPALAYQASFENQRRWLTWDLLAGRVDRRHPMWSFLRWAGLSERALDDLTGDPCPADVIGINHYVSSDRFLDHRVELYSPELLGGNGRHRYVDLDAVRVCEDRGVGVGELARQAHARYGVEVALTEVHLGGVAVEDQLRWLVECWREARQAPVVALTVWSLLGCHDWSSLLTEARGDYEPGVFDISSGAPVERELGSVVRQLAAGREPEHPMLAGSGWWHRDERLLHRRRQASDAA